MDIPITCKGQKYVPIQELIWFQGQLKSLSNQSHAKLKKSILQHGFAFPVIVWQNYIIDGHQRVRIVKELIEDGASIGDIPVVEIEAQTEEEAAQKLLLFNSRYGEITTDSLSIFIKEFSLPQFVLDDLSFPDIDLGGLFPAERENDDFVPEKDPNIIIRISVHPGMWLGKRQEMIGIFEKLQKTYDVTVKIEE